MKIWIGTYTSGTASQGIYQAAFDPSTGALTGLRAAGEAPDPSYLLRAPDGESLYAVCECPTFAGVPGGGVARFSIDKSGRLLRREALPSGGGAPCHLARSEDGRFLAVANYGDGTVSVYELAADGALHAPVASLRYAAKGPNEARQECAHAHFCAFDGDVLFCCDLGADRVRRYDARTWIERSPVPLPSGSGPRHLLFRPDGGLFVVSELTSELFTLLPDGRGGYSLADAQPCLPADAGESWAAALRQGPDGRLFVSNRGHDSVSVFRLDAQGLPVREGVYSCGGAYPRDLLAVGEDCLLCACQRSNEVTCLRRTAAGWRVASRLAVPAPVCLTAK